MLNETQLKVQKIINLFENLGFSSENPISEDELLTKISKIIETDEEDPLFRCLFPETPHY